jgi:general secretion pathway protein I
VLVALTILAMSLAVMFQVFSRGLDTTSDASARSVATSMAQSLLARIGPEIPLVEGESRGRFDNGFQWRIRISLYEPDRYREIPFVRPYDVAVDVSWDERHPNRHIELATLRLAKTGVGQ